MSLVDSKSDLPERKRLRLRNYDYAQGGGYFITINVNGKIPLLGKMDGQQVVLNEVGGMVLQIWNEQPQHFPGVMVDAFVVMPNHIHGIVILTDPKLIAGYNGPVQGTAPTQKEKCVKIPNLIRQFKSFSSKLYRDIKASHPNSRLPERLWQRSCYERIIRSESDLEEKREYIETNPLRRFLKESV